MDLANTSGIWNPNNNRRLPRFPGVIVEDNPNGDIFDLPSTRQTPEIDLEKVKEDAKTAWSWWKKLTGKLAKTIVKDPTVEKSKEVAQSALKVAAGEDIFTQAALNTRDKAIEIIKGGSDKLTQCATNGAKDIFE